MSKYKIYYQENNIIKTKYVDDINIEDNNFPKNIIKIKKSKDINFKNINLYQNISKKDVLNLFIELEMILNADILLSDAIDILLKSTKKQLLKEILLSMKKALLNGKPIYKSLEKYEKYLDPLIIPFFIILERKGSINIVISSLTTLLKIKMKNQDNLVSSLRYPIIVFITFIFSLVLIFNFVVPKFEAIFVQYKMDLPLSTKMLLSFKDFFITNYFFIFISILSLFLLFKIACKKSEKITMFFDKCIIKYIPIISKLMLTYELYNFFIAVNILLKSKYEFHTAIDNSMTLIKNKYLLDRITQINKHLKNGKTIVSSFEQTALFDDIIISLLNSGEKSSSLDVSIEKIEKIYKNSFQKSIKNLTSLIEPIFFITISLLILWIMLAIFTPIWNMNGMLNS